MPFPLNVWLIHPEPATCDAFARRFADLPSVRVIRDAFENLPPHNCFVTAGNSYGIMTAGIDAAVVRRHGQELMERVQHRILDHYLGEQPIGTAFIEPTGNPEYPYVCHSPTMRTPGSINRTDKIYAATFAAFLAVYHHNLAAAEDAKIDTVVFPAMGTGFGGVAADESARQMAVAYRHYLSPPHRLDWDAVIERQKAIAYDGNRQVL